MNESPQSSVNVAMSSFISGITGFRVLKVASLHSEQTNVLLLNKRPAVSSSEMRLCSVLNSKGP